MLHIPVILALASYTSAHFVLNWPPTAGFDDDAEATAPCGGATVTVNSTSPQVNVDRFAADILVTHPTGTFTFLATTDTSAPYNFTELQTIKSSGQGTFCANYLSVPSSFAGKGGVLRVIDNSIDGILYQCAPVNWISGSNSTIGETCSNSTGVSLTYAAAASSALTATTTTGSATAAAATSTTKSGMAAVMTMAIGPIVGGLGAVAAGLIL